MDNNVENKIIEAARQVFFEKGYNGTTMRDIAQTAGVNLALLHYYFRTKDKIFEIVFREAFSLLFASISKAVNADTDIFDKIRRMVNGYMLTAYKYPQLPGFVMNEMSVNPQLMMPVIMKHKEQNNAVHLFNSFYVEIENAIQKGIIKRINPKDLCTDILSLSLFPFIAKNCLTELIYENKKSFNQMLKERAERVSNTVINDIKQ